MKSKANKSTDSILIIVILVLCIFIIYTSFSKMHTQSPTIIPAEKKVVVTNHILPPRRRINIQTRGELPAYKNIGYVSNKNNENEVLSLYGRPTYRGSQNWNYYTMHEGIRIPIEECDRSKGCREKYEGDKVNIDAMGDNYEIRLYKDDEPRYIPF